MLQVALQSCPLPVNIYQVGSCENFQIHSVNIPLNCDIMISL